MTNQIYGRETMPYKFSQFAPDRKKHKQQKFHIEPKSHATKEIAPLMKHLTLKRDSINFTASQ